MEIRIYLIKQQEKPRYVTEEEFLKLKADLEFLKKEIETNKDLTKDPELKIKLDHAMFELCKEFKCQFKDSLGPREADKIGLPMPLEEFEERDVFMPRFIKRYVQVMYTGGALAKTDFDKPMLAMLAFRDDRLQKLFNEYVGV